jgi:PleD family two-component response regulator/EAL domain-containing protein (putative c-di-GMP-specific phosphodiesterase class I)
MNIANSTKERINILLVDDSPTNLNLLSTMLSEYGYQTRRVISGHMALQAVKTDNFDLILLDINMPKMDGYEVCSRLKEDPQTAHIPVIFISALNETLDKVKALNVGGVDYIIKPFAIEEVNARITNQIKIVRAQLQNQKNNTDLKHKLSQQNEELKNTNKKLILSQQNLLKKTLEDPITHLANRFALISKLRQNCKILSQEKDGFEFTILALSCYCHKLEHQFIDLSFADQIAIAITEKLNQNLSDRTNFLARLEGNEFIIILNKVALIEQGIKIVQQLNKNFSTPFVINGKELLFRLDYGLVVVNQSQADDDPDSLLREARKLAFEQSKKQRDRQAYNSDTERSYGTVLDIDAELKQAWERHELNILYQPIISLNQGILQGGDVFVSWLDRGVKNIISGQLFAAIQDQQLSLEILKYLLKQACLDLKRWQEIILWSDESKYSADENFIINFKLFGQQLFLPNLSNNLNQIVQESRVSSQNISLEISESLIQDNLSLVTDKIQELKSLGFAITIDDLNIGNFKIDYYYNFDNLKINTPYISKTNQEERKWADVTKKIALARDAKMSVTAIDIKKSEQLKLMRKYGCKFAQGSFIYKPVPRKAIETLIIQNPWYGTQDFSSRG